MTGASEVVSEAAKVVTCFSCLYNYTFNYFFEEEAVWQPVKTILIIALCTKGVRHKGGPRKEAPFCSQELRSSHEHAPPFSRCRRNCVENAVGSHF
jgi:hypothetical protein